MTLLCQDIEGSFQKGKKAGAVFLDLTAAYNTVWMCVLHMKILKTILDKHMIRFIMMMLSNSSFQLHSSNGQRSCLQQLRNSVPLGFVFALMLFKIYIHDLPATQSGKYGYADDLAILLTRPFWKEEETSVMTRRSCQYT